jgi:hypothetical protein
MSTEGQKDGTVTRILDPGEDGWAPEPKITKAEGVLFGRLAGVVRVLGTASVAAQEAYSLACKHGNEDWGESVSDVAQARSDAVYGPVIQQAWELYRAAEKAHQDIAAAALKAHAEMTAVHGEPVDRGEVPATA